MYINMCTDMFAGMLWSGAFTSWIGHLTQWHIYPILWTDCKLGYFLLNFAAEYSSMLLAVMSIEKLVALYFPLKAKSYCTVGTAKWVTGILATIMAAFNSPILIWYKAIGKGCFMMNHRKYFIMLNTVFYSLVPTFSMLLANAAIIYKLMYIKYKGISHTKQSVSKSSNRGSVMVISVSLTFIILTTPRAVYNFLSLNFSRTPLRSFLIILMQYLNHSINGVLYCIFGKKFRNELGKIIQSCRKKRLSENCATSMSSVTNETITTNTL